MKFVDLSLVLVPRKFLLLTVKEKCKDYVWQNMGKRLCHYLTGKKTIITYSIGLISIHRCFMVVDGNRSNQTTFIK